MDQQAFRSFLATSKPAASSSTAAPAPAPTRSLGHHQRRAADIPKATLTPSTSSSTAPIFKPRQQAGRGGFSSSRGSSRPGLGAAPSPRARATEDGSASPSHAVVSAPVRDGEGDEDDERPRGTGLDFEAIQRARREAAEAAELRAEHALDGVLTTEGDEVSTNTKKRSRAEMLAELKRSRGSAPPAEEQAASSSKAQLGKGFKPIGKSSSDAAAAPDVKIGADGKRLRKKKKVAKQPAEEVTPLAARASADPAQPLGAAETRAEPEKPRALPAVEMPALGDDDDIFGGVEEWKAPEGDNDDDDDDDVQSSLADDDEENIEQSGGRMDEHEDEKPSEQRKAAAASVSAAKPDEPQRRQYNGPAMELPLSDEEEDEDEGDLGRPLAPLDTGDGAASVRDILARDDEAAKEEKRRARKLKYGAKPQEGEEKLKKDRSEQDKLNHEYQRLSKFLDKKQGASSKGDAA